MASLGNKLPESPMAAGNDKEGSEKSNDSMAAQQHIEPRYSAARSPMFLAKNPLLPSLDDQPLIEKEDMEE